MKLAFKIFLIVLVLGGIGSAIYFFIRGMGEKAPDDDIETTKFEEYIGDRVNDEIKGKSYEAASKAYDDIMSEISDVANSTKSEDGKEDRSITKREETNSRKLAYYGYSPIFVKHTEEFFKRSSWDENEMNSLKKRAGDLLATKLSDEKAKNKPKIQEVITYVDGYYAAKSIIAQANNCTSVSVAKSMPEKIRPYQKTPYTFNNFLASGLSNAPTRAKESCAAHIKSQCNSIINTYYRGGYGTMNAMQAAADRWDGLVKEYMGAFGRTSLFDDAIRNLANALTQASYNLPAY